MQWVTRQYLHLDRVATPWLITRFVDAEATFVYVPWKEEHLAPAGAMRFQSPGPSWARMTTAARPLTR